MTAVWLEEAVEASGLGVPVSFPCDLAGVVPLRLPLGIVPLPGLSTALLRDWLVRWGVPHAAPGPARPLHGALVARAGKGLLFVDSDDDLDEQRFTVAHETAHFIADHVVIRTRTVRACGTRIIPVLDGERLPTPEEAVSAMLSRAPLGCHLHLMVRGSTGLVSNWLIEDSEQRADRLALELIAPREAALRLLDGTPNGRFVSPIQATEVLSTRFGLPRPVARSYALLILSRSRQRPKLSKALLAGRG